MSKSLKIVIAAAYVLMIAANTLANLLPINQLTSGQVSDSYPNLFAPAPYTFGIWGLIYLLLALHVLYLFHLFGGPKTMNKAMLKRVGILFALSSVINAVWIVAWHYLQIPLTLALMSVLFVCLAVITGTYKKMKLEGRDRWFLALPFSVYFGWITVATIANITVYLVSIGWNGFFIPTEYHMAAVLLIGTLLGGLTVFKRKDLAYGMVMVWAFSGILVKHVSDQGFAGAYPLVWGTAIACLILLLAVIGIAVFGRGKRIGKPDTAL